MALCGCIGIFTDSPEPPHQTPKALLLLSITQAGLKRGNTLVFDDLTLNLHEPRIGLIGWAKRLLWGDAHG